MKINPRFKPSCDFELEKQKYRSVCCKSKGRKQKLCPVGRCLAAAMNSKNSKGPVVRRSADAGYDFCLQQCFLSIVQNMLAGTQMPLFYAMTPGSSPDVCSPLEDEAYIRSVRRRVLVKLLHHMRESLMFHLVKREVMVAFLDKEAGIYLHSGLLTAIYGLTFFRTSSNPAKDFSEMFSKAWNVSFYEYGLPHRCPFHSEHH